MPGAFFVSLAVIYIIKGKAWTRSILIERSKEPKWYWWQITLYLLCGIWLIYVGLVSH